MLTFLAIVALLAVLYSFTLGGRTIGDDEFTFPNLLPKPVRIPTAVVAFLLFFTSSIFFKTDSATNYTLQYPFFWDAITVSGDGQYHMKWGATVLETDKEVAITQLGPDHWLQAKENPGEWIESKEVYLIAQNRLELNDRIGIYPDFSTVLQLSSGSEAYTQMVLKTKTEENLVYSRILPYIQKCQQYAVKLLSSEQYIAGGNAKFDQYVLDQYLNGPYVLEEIVKNKSSIDTLGGEAIVTIGTDEGVSIEYKRIDDPESPGGYLRTGEQGFATYGISIIQAGIKSTEYESGFETRLESLKSIAADKQKAKENAEMYKLQQEEEKEYGELEKIKERAVKEKEQVSAVIAAKTKAEKAQYFKEEQQNMLAGEKIATQVAEEKRKQVVAARAGGIDPYIVLDKELQNRVDVAKAIFGGQALGSLETYIGGSRSGGGKDGMDYLLQYMMTNQLSNKPTQ